jgi:hypothetical protein
LPMSVFYRDAFPGISLHFSGLDQHFPFCFVAVHLVWKSRKESAFSLSLRAQVWSALLIGGMRCVGCLITFLNLFILSNNIL